MVEKEEALKRSLVGRLFNLPDRKVLEKDLTILVDSPCPVLASDKPARRTLSFQLTDGSVITLQFRNLYEQLYECFEHRYERSNAQETIAVIVKKNEDGSVSVSHETEAKLTHLLFSQGEISAMPEGCITAKQVGLLQARYREAGFSNDRSFLEWLEFQSGLDIEADCLEQIPSARLDRILKVLASR